MKNIQDTKLSIAIDMGAKNNGVFIAKTYQDNIIHKKSSCVVVDGNINFSKASRTINRHKDRNYSRKHLARRLLLEIINKKNFNEPQLEMLTGLLKNRGFTFLNSSTDFDTIDNSIDKIIIEKNLLELKNLYSKENFEDYIANFDDEIQIKDFIISINKKIEDVCDDLNFFSKKKDIIKDLQNLENLDTVKFIKFYALALTKNILYNKGLFLKGKQKEITDNVINLKIDFSSINFDEIITDINNIHFSTDIFVNKDGEKLTISDIKNQLISIKKLLLSFLNEIETGSKPRLSYLKDIKQEIESCEFDFITVHFSKEELYNIIGNISNLQLRILRKFFNNNTTKARLVLLKNYIKAHHYKLEKEIINKDETLKNIETSKDFIVFLKTSDPKYLIPPYEDMNNRDTYKCQTILINPKYITKDIEKSLDIVLNNKIYQKIKINLDGELSIINNIRSDLNKKTKKYYEQLNFTIVNIYQDFLMLLIK